MGLEPSTYTLITINALQFNNLLKHRSTRNEQMFMLRFEPRSLMTEREHSTNVAIHNLKKFVFIKDEGLFSKFSIFFLSFTILGHLVVF